ncbi:hypothetical protein RO21_11620 [[Actinobacillus] muris]|uniref:Uncharacterized protein n=1 Tax=Muribacter muris TaxID=67855 RepID=A0A0J5P1R8_9PAST|nr:hypothetical protein RO21_11620 [[Actinobacillus] muris] [Muribacter muris]
MLSERAQWLSDVVEVIGIGRSDTESFIVLQWIPEGLFTPVIEAVALKDLGEREGWKQLKARGC